MGNLVHICAPRPDMVKIIKSHCGTCERKSPMVVFFYEWYDPDSTCLRCGERYNADGRAPRPFRPAWRKQSKADAKARYRMWNP